jgi:hypothetical protein
VQRLRRAATVLAQGLLHALTTTPAANNRIVAAHGRRRAPLPPAASRGASVPSARTPLPALPRHASPLLRHR